MSVSQTVDAQGVDELLRVVGRLGTEFGGVPIGVLMDVVMACRSELSSTPLGAGPEKVERMARTRLAAGGQDPS